MQIELEISDRIIRKLRALSILEENSNSASIEQLVMEMLEKTLDSRIRSHVEGPDEEGPASGFSMPMLNMKRETAAFYKQRFDQQVAQASRMDTDESGMSDGLGDFEEDMPEGESDAEALVPKKGGVSSRDLDTDMDVEDPEHEAKAEAAEFPPDVVPEHIFSSMVMGNALPPPEDVEVDPRIQRRKRKLKIRGRVSGATEDNLNDLL